ncbi:O-antigen translocase, partial [Citrobacter portucalensis]|uniref:O-antigen translocase n=1 Tax=Citrobacter portucalensis TaxID=1639133 RepID=UPI00226BAD6C
MNKLIKVIASTGVLTLAKMAMGFVIAKVVAVYTGPSGMALLGQVQSAVSALNGIMSSSVGNGIVRYTSEYNNKGYGHCSLWWRASLQWALILYGIIMPILVYYSEDVAIWLFYDKSYAWLVSLCAFTLPLSTLGTLFTSIINGYKNFKRFVILGMISVIISSACMILFIINYNLKGALIAAVMQSVLIGFIMIVFNIRQPWFKLRFFLGKTTAESRKQVGSYIIIALVSAVMAPVTLIIVRNILIGTVGWEQTGEWQAVWKISEVYLG